MNNTINGLERELAETKIKLAESETNKEEYLRQLSSRKPEIQA